MLAFRTTKSEPNSFIYRNCNTSEKGAEKKHFSSVNQNLQLWMLRIFSEKFLIRFFYGKKSYRLETDNQIKADSKTVGIKV